MNIAINDDRFMENNFKDNLIFNCSKIDNKIEMRTR